MRTQPPFVVTCVSLALASCTLSPGGLGAAGSAEETGDVEVGAGRAPRQPPGFAPSSLGDGGMEVASATPVVVVDGGVDPSSAPAQPDGGGGGPDLAVPDASPAPESPPPSPPPPGPSPAQELRVHDLKAKRIIARVVYAHRLTAEKGTAGMIFPAPDASLLDLDLGSRDLEVDELVVDVLRAHDIKADWIQIGEAHAAVKIGKEMPGGD
jgi:hypothetical protein